MSIEVSNEVRAKEIHAKARSYYTVSEQYAYKFLMELKTLRNERLFRELGYTSFDKYCQAEWGVKRASMDERISMADEYGEEVTVITGSFGHRKSLLLSRMDREIRTDVMENGIPTESGRKSVESATQQEIAAYQRALKEKEAEIEEERIAKEQAERQAEIERRERERLEAENEELANREPEVVTEYVEKEKEIPYDRTHDEPYAVEQGNDFYALMREVDEVYKKYAHLQDGIEELRNIARYDDDLAVKYRKASVFWDKLSEIFEDDGIVDAEIIY